MQIHVALCELTEMPVDAIVNPTNSAGTMTQGVGAAILRRGGTGIQSEACSSAPIAVGAAVVTTAGSLHCRSVIHVPVAEDPAVKTTIENVRRATRAALVAAAARGLETIALPPMADDEAIPVEESARAMVDELRAHRQPMPTTVYLVASDDEGTAAFESALRNASNPG